MHSSAKAATHIRCDRVWPPTDTGSCPRPCIGAVSPVTLCNSWVLVSRDSWVDSVNMSGRIIEMFLPVSTVILQGRPSSFPGVIKPSGLQCTEPVLKIAAVLATLVASLCPARPATCRFPGSDLHQFSPSSSQGSFYRYVISVGRNNKRLHLRPWAACWGQTSPFFGPFRDAWRIPVLQRGIPALISTVGPLVRSANSLWGY